MTIACRDLYAVFLLVAILLMATATAAGAATTAFTSLLPTSENGECEWRENAFADEDAFLCPGMGGYRVYVREEGVDSWLAFTRGRELSDLHAGILRVTGADVIALTGEPLEWRMADDRPVAAIFQARTESGSGGDTTTYIVARISGDRVCVAGRAADEATAKRMADGGGGCR